MPIGQDEEAVPRVRFEHALGQRLYPCRHLEGFVYVVFVIDAYARRIVGWRVDNRRLLETIGNIPSAEAEANFKAVLETANMAASRAEISLRRTRRGSVQPKSQA